ncbi:hypothetical protein LTR56_016609 [Elasticomyces elasticus]|nr:hypothetical protein LTR56_016609 [Elasticomyces elasticus]KAK3650640.1 hypothetical protein LTR22_012498 [Elasticomyces elasticus]KAK4913973.1 hypothetical protein LTR49_017791 [Elasticomyces elasticus]KAK5753137.1 hypothetical protein LTS12_016816 [Elasticomyces elasticus]
MFGLQSEASQPFIVGGREFPRVTWYRHGSLIRLHLIIGILLLSSATNGYDGSMMNGLQTLDYWQNHFNTPSAAKLGLLNAIFSVGQVCGLPFVPLLADGIGRKWTILLGSTLIFIGVVIQTVSTTIGMFIAARFIIGLGICYTQSYGTLTIASEWSWKAPSVLQAFPSVIQLFLIWLVPESPRYQIVKDKHEIARKTFQTYHGPASGDEFVEAEYQEVLETMALEKEFAKRGISELWNTRGNRHRFLIALTAGFFSQTAGSGIVSYYIFLVLKQIGITNSKDQLLLNGGLTIFNFVMPLFLTSTFGMCLAMTGWTIASQQYSVTSTTTGGRAVIALIFVFMFFYNLAWSGLLIAYVVEISPFYLRSKYLTVTLLAVAAGSFFTNYVNPVAMEAITWKYYLCYIIWLAFQSVVVWFYYIETKGRSLEAIAVCFEGDDAKVGGAGATEKAKELLGVLQTDGALGKGGDIELQVEHSKI